MTSPTKNLEHGLFASRETLEEAIAYSDSLIKSLPLEHQMTAYTAMWVSLNTSIQETAKKDISSVLPLPVSELPEKLKISEMSPELATTVVRSILIPTIQTGKELCEFPLLGDMFSELNTFVLMVSRMFNLTVDDLIAEIMAAKSLES